MDIQRAFTFVTKDKSWASKLAVGAILGILSFLLLPLFIINGYSLAVARRVAEGEESLPEWELGKNMQDGFLLTVAQFIYFIPGFLLLIAGGGIGSLFTGDGSGSGFAAGGFTLLTCLAGIYSLLLLFIIPAVFAQYARYGTLGACLRFAEVWEIVRTQLGNIVMVFVGLFLLALGFTIINVVLNIVPCLGQIASILLSLAFVPFSAMVAGHLFGQLMSKLEPSGWVEKG